MWPSKPVSPVILFQQRRNHGKKRLTFVFICAFISAALLFSGCRSHSPEHKAEFMVDYIAETLDLNDEQRGQLEEIKEEFIAKVREMRVQK